MCGFFFFQAEDGIRDLVRSRGLGDVYKRQVNSLGVVGAYYLARRLWSNQAAIVAALLLAFDPFLSLIHTDAADERSSVDLGGRRIIKKKRRQALRDGQIIETKQQL